MEKNKTNKENLEAINNNLKEIIQLTKDADKNVININQKQAYITLIFVFFTALNLSVFVYSIHLSMKSSKIQENFLEDIGTQSNKSIEVQREISRDLKLLTGNVVNQPKQIEREIHYFRGFWIGILLILIIGLIIFLEMSKKKKLK